MSEDAVSLAREAIEHHDPFVSADHVCDFGRVGCRFVAFAQALLDAEQALAQIDQVEPFSGTAQLDVNDWAAALDKAQDVARAALSRLRGEDVELEASRRDIAILGGDPSL